MILYNNLKKNKKWQKVKYCYWKFMSIQNSTPEILVDNINFSNTRKIIIIKFINQHLFYPQKLLRAKQVL